MRLFISIPLSKENRTAIETAFDIWKEKGIQGWYSKIENLHLTLAFLGETDPDRVSLLKTILQDIRFPALTLNSKGLDLFGNILVLRFEENPDLKEAVKRLQNRLKENGFPVSDKPFKLHLTLIRKCTLKKDSLPAAPEITVNVRTVDLMESILKPEGPLYQVLYSVPVLEDGDTMKQESTGE